MPVGELLARTSSAELTEWAAYETIAGPLGRQRDDTLMAILSSTIANVNRTKKSKRFRPADFMPQWEPKVAQTWQEQLTVVEALNRQFGGTDRRLKGG